MRISRLFRVFFLLTMLALFACQPKDLGYGVNDLPDGDAARGAEIFAQGINGATACVSCHAVDDGQKSGPTLSGFGAVAGSREGDQSAAEYTFNSILRPAKHIVRGYSNVMPSDYADKLTQQDIADLIAYLLSLQ